MSDVPAGRPTGGIDEDLQREIDEALGGQNVEELLESASSAGGSAASAAVGSSSEEGAAGAPGTPGVPGEFHHEIRRGRISAVRGEDVFVDLVGADGKLQGVVPLQQFERPPRIGSIMDFVVERIDEGQGLVFLSREGAISRTTWDQLQKGSIVDARVTATNKGGLELEMVGNIRAFMPASQIDLHHIDDLEPLVGQKLEAIVAEIDRRGKKVLLSRRALLQQRRERAKDKLMAELEEGQVRDGKVSNIVDFGAFVDLGGVDGLVHISDLSYTHVGKPSDAVTLGQAVKVKVLKIDKEHGRISLGLKQVAPDPWDGIETRITVGEQLAARVLRTANFGAFAEVEPGVEALMPLSELSWKRIHSAGEAVQPGQVVHCKVISLDPAKKRMSLSVKQASGDPWTGVEHEFAQGGTHEGKVIGTTDFGAFVELKPGVEGMVHISELSDRRVGAVTDVVKVGDVKPFRILEVDEEQRRIRLSLKPESAGTSAPAPAPGEGRGKQAAAAANKPASGGAKRQPRKDLKSGLGDGGALGMGLGNLRLEDLK